MNKLFLIKRIAFVMAAIMCFAALCGCARSRDDDDDDRDLPELVIGSDYYEPFVYKNDDGELKGLDVEIVKEVCKQLRLKPKFVHIDWEKKSDYLSRGEIDCIWGCFSLTGREDDYSWSLPYMNTRQAVAVSENSNIFAISDLQGKRVAVQTTSKPDEIFSRQTKDRPAIPELNSLNIFPDMSYVFAAIADGYVDAIAGHEEALLEYMKASSLKLRILEEPLLEAQIGVAFLKGTHADVIERINKAFRLLKNNGFCAELFSSYGLDPQNHVVNYEKT